MDAAAYLSRIGDPRAQAPDAATLARIHRAHLLHVPFENLDIHLGRLIDLQPDALEEKIVGARRGGFCYELNGLFAELLLALGFDVSLAAARSVEADGTLAPPRDHLALIVDLEGPQLADVGYGDLFLEPLELRAGAQGSARDRFRLDEVPGGWRLSRWREGAWVPQYVLDPTPRNLEDFEDMCRYHSSSPASTFTRKRVCSLATPRGRVTLTDERLVETVDGERTERAVTAKEADALLSTTFGMGAGVRWPRKLLQPPTDA